jgi:hypothetical protein
MCTSLQDFLDSLPRRINLGAYLFPGRFPGTRLNRVQGWLTIKGVFAAPALWVRPGKSGRTRCERPLHG